MDTGRESREGGGIAFLSSSIALLPSDSFESRVSSDVGLDPLPSSSSSLIPNSICSSVDGFRLNCGSRLLLFDFFEASFSELGLESVGKFEHIELCGCC
jgi:hypothetical protein